MGSEMCIRDRANFELVFGRYHHRFGNVVQILHCNSGSFDADRSASDQADTEVVANSRSVVNDRDRTFSFFTPPDMDGQ